MSMRRIGAIAFRIIRQFLRDKRTMALLFLAPIVVMTILQFVLNSSSSSAVLAIVPPAGPAGTAIVSHLQSQFSSSDSITLKIMQAGQVENSLKSGDIDGALIFPSDFTQQLLLGETPTIILQLSGANPGVAKQLSGIGKILIAGITGSTPNAAAGSATINTPNLQTTYMYGGPQFTQTDAMAPLFIGLFSYFFVFLLTSVSFLRERSQGTIERLMVSPSSRTELVLGYICGFTVFALAQSAIILLYVIYILQVHYAGNPLTIFLVTALLTIGGVNMGIFVSAFARNELQIIQFIPLLLTPQILLGGLFFPVKTLPVVLHQLAYVFPLTYANFALQDIMIKGFGVGDIWGDVLFMIAFALAMALLAAFSLRQEKV